MSQGVHSAMLTVMRRTQAQQHIRPTKAIVSTLAWEQLTALSENQITNPSTVFGLPIEHDPKQVEIVRFV